MEVGRIKNKREDSTVESNDISEIPDRGRHQTSLASLPVQSKGGGLSV